MGRKHDGKRRNCSLRAISPFPTVFSKDLYCRHVKKPGQIAWEKVKMSSAICFNLDQSKFLSSGNGLIPFAGALTLSSIYLYTHFNTLEEKSFRKTLRKKVKLLKMSNFTFSYNVFYAICILNSFNPLPDNKILDWSKLKQIADEILKYI